MSILDKKNTPKNVKKNNKSKNTRHQNATKGGQFLHLACQGGGSSPCPSRQLGHWLLGFVGYW